MGPLGGVRVIEMGGLGPGPFAGMMLADHGAEVIRVERPGVPLDERNPMLRSRHVVSLDLKTASGAAQLRALVATAHCLIDVFRPGVMERLGLGPEVLLPENEKLVYARMTGWGQAGPYAAFAGHDLNYLSLAGAAHAIGPPECPVPPLALIGDYGGGGMMLAFAVVSALLHARESGMGQVIDCAMADGAGLLMTQSFGLLASGEWRDVRGVNILDGGAHFYNVYETADAQFVSVASIESQFYARLLELLGLADDADFRMQHDREKWPVLKERLAELFRTRTRDEWCELLEYPDVCFAPVLSMTEAPAHPQAISRASFMTLDGVVQPAPAPRFSASPAAVPRRPAPAEIARFLG